MRNTNITRINRRHPHLAMGKCWNTGAKENESCKCRNKIRVGKDAFALLETRQRKDDDINNLESAVCPLCEERTRGRYHPYTECPITKPKCDALLPLLTNAKGGQDAHVRSDHDTLFSKILNPSNWSTASNQLINDWCAEINSTVHTSIVSKKQPSLAAIITTDHCQDIRGDEQPLNANIIGKIFDIKITEDVDQMKVGTWRMRVNDYDPLDGTFTCDSYGLDIWPHEKDDNGWFEFTDLDMNEMLNLGYLNHCHERNVVELSRNDIHKKILKGQVFDEKVVKRTIEVRNYETNHFENYKITSYDRSNKKHTLLHKNGKYESRDLNAEWVLGQVRHPTYLLCLLAHLKARMLSGGGGCTVPLAQGPRSRRETRGRCRKGMADSSNQLVS
jgi:hypothetical protein